jgi:hypothetical protein
MLGMSKERTGLRLAAAVVVELEEDDEMDDEKERCGEDEDVTSL